MHSQSILCPAAYHSDSCHSLQFTNKRLFLFKDCPLIPETYSGRFFLPIKKAVASLARDNQVVHTNTKTLSN